MTTLDERPVVTPTSEKHSVWARLYRGETTFDFVRNRKIGFIISGLILLASVISLSTRGLNLGIDFKGGVAWEFPSNGVTTSDVNGILASFGLDKDAKVQTLRNGSESKFRVQVGPEGEAKQNEVQQAFAEAAKVGVGDVNLTSVGPSWGKEISSKARTALIVFFVVIVIYISLRFEWKMALAALAAMVHDVAISVGVYSIFGFEVTPATVIAFLTILGFSLYDTIVVFDRVDDNTKKLSNGKVTYSDIVNLSMNQTLMRSLNTSMAAVLPVLSLLVVGSIMFGAVALQDFSIALLVGLVTGAYSSIFIASPLLAMLKERERRWQATRERLGATTAPVADVRAVATGLAVTARPARSPAAAATGSADPAALVPTGPIPGYSHPPRPRKKGRR
ncbi:MAG: protein translocase subunit SecF [Acidimicrobiales bacterium]